eukprot:scaffold238920_cov19-Tisochrysis_lutea.AAC.2
MAETVLVDLHERGNRGISFKSWLAKLLWSKWPVVHCSFQGYCMQLKDFKSFLLPYLARVFCDAFDQSACWK